MLRSLFPKSKDVARNVGKTVWDKDRSPILEAYRAIRDGKVPMQTGIPEGQLELFQRAVQRGHTWWRMALFVVPVGAVLYNFFEGWNSLANFMFMMIFVLVFVETTKYSFFIWHCRTREGFKEYLKHVMHYPSIILFPNKRI
jgi:hypothetical protein